jgi:hypothetical protein
VHRVGAHPHRRRGETAPHGLHAAEPRAHRRPHRLPQPPLVPGAVAERGHSASAARRPALAAAVRPRPLQADQRHLRPSGRRRGARAHRSGAARGDPVTRRGGPHRQ